MKYHIFLSDGYKACWQFCETADTKGTHQRPFVSYNNKYIHYFDLVITVFLCMVSQQSENKIKKKQQKQLLVQGLLRTACCEIIELRLNQFLSWSELTKRRFSVPFTKVWAITKVQISGAKPLYIVGSIWTKKPRLMQGHQHFWSKEPTKYGRWEGL